MAEEAVRYELRDKVAVVHLDDGKANALSPALIEALHRALDRADEEAGSFLLVGRPGRFCGGFDLAVMRSGAEAVRGLVTAGAELFVRFLEYPRPISVACTGHAVAAGALVLLAADTRIGARGAFKIGLNEVAIGMTLPIFAVELARQRLSKRHFTHATTQARFYAPEEALDAGFFDRLEGPEALFASALAEAARLAEVPQPAFRHTKARVQRAVIATIRDTLEDDMSGLSGPTAT